MRVSPYYQPQISSEENFPEENVPKSFEYVQPPESKKSFNNYNTLFGL